MAAGVTATRTGSRSISAASAPISLRHGGREEQALAPGRKLGEDLPDGPDEAHVEHLVGLVEDEDLRARQHDAALLDVLEEPAGRGDEDVDAAAHGIDLRPVRDAAVHQGDGQVRVASVGLEALRDLRRELARRRQDERARAPPHAPGRLVGGEPVQDRQREGRRLAGAGLGDAQQVLAGQHAWDGLRLDRGRRRVALGVRAT